MSRPVVVSFLWPKNYPVLLELARKGQVDIAAPVSLVPAAMSTELAKHGARLIPLIGPKYAHYRTLLEHDARVRVDRIREALPALLSTPSAATPETTAQSVAVLEELLLPTMTDSMTMVDELDDLAANEDIVAMLVNETDLPLGKLASHWARARGIPSFLLSHGGNIGTAYTITRCMHADYLFVFSQRGTETYIDIGIPPERIVLTGNPAWDHYPNVLENKAKYRETAYQSLGLRAGEPLIVFATIWNTKLTAALESNIFEKTVRSFFRACKRLRDSGLKFNAVVKDRPSNADFGKSETARIAAEESFDDYAYGMGDMEAYIASADLLVSHDSNVFVEAMITGVPAINLWTPSSWLIGPAFDVRDGIPMIQYTNDEALADVMRAALTDAAFRETVISQMARSLPRFHLAIDGLSTTRVVDAILHLCKKPAQPQAAANGVREEPVLERDRKMLRLLRGRPATLLHAGHASELLVQELRTLHPGMAVNAIGMDRGQPAAFPEALGANSVDTVVLTNTLCELRDPLAFMVGLRPLLTKDARLVLSIANVRNLWMINEVLSGRWEWAVGDILDPRNVRFFTLSGIVELLAAAGYRVEQVEHVLDERVGDVAVPQSGSMNLDTGIATLKHMSAQDIFELRTLEFLLLAVPEAP